MKIKINLGAVSEALQSERLKTGDWGMNYPVIDKEKCTACKTCEQYCPDMCIEVRKFDDEKYAVVDYDYCKGCGICASVCPVEAINMKLKDIFKLDVC